MPTDPFVPPDPSSRPRQQQNLPPGVALPAADRWEADRPGELGPEQPAGARLGSPGPNIGYAYTLAERLRDRLRTTAVEHADDAVAVIAEIAAKRAALFGRAPVITDVEVAIALLGYDGSADEDFAVTRARLVGEADHLYGRRRAVVDLVPAPLLRAPAADAKSGAAAWRSEVLAGAAPAPAP